MFSNYCSCSGQVSRSTFSPRHMCWHRHTVRVRMEVATTTTRVPTPIPSQAPQGCTARTRRRQGATERIRLQINWVRRETRYAGAQRMANQPPTSAARKALIADRQFQRHMTTCLWQQVCCCSWQVSLPCWCLSGRGDAGDGLPRLQLGQIFPGQDSWLGSHRELPGAKPARLQGGRKQRPLAALVPTTPPARTSLRGVR